MAPTIRDKGHIIRNISGIEASSEGLSDWEFFHLCIQSLSKGQVLASLSLSYLIFGGSVPPNLCVFPLGRASRSGFVLMCISFLPLGKRFSRVCLFHLIFVLPRWAEWVSSSCAFLSMPLGNVSQSGSVPPNLCSFPLGKTSQSAFIPLVHFCPPL